MNNLSRVIVILASLASLVAIVWMLTRRPPPPLPLPPPAGVDVPTDLKANQDKPINVPPEPERHPAVNDPDKIINVRRPQHIYDTQVVGQASGEASSEDWGIRGEAKFNLTWSLQSTGEVISNDGRVIIEQRSFKYNEVLTIDAVRAGLNMSEGQAWGIATVVGGIGELLTTGTLNGAGIVGVKESVDKMNRKMVSVPPTALQAMSKLAKWTGVSKLDLDEGIKAVLPRPEFGMLDGKSVRLTFEDGKGITRIEPLGCALSEQERNVILRTNNLADHYIFPDRTRAVGQAWEVPADNLGSLVDPRLRGAIVNRNVRVKRTDDGVDEGSGRVLTVAIDGMQRLSMAKAEGGREITGEMQLDEARFELPDSAGVVTYAEATGTVEYRERTTDHLLFGAEIRGRPSFQVYVKTIVRKKS
jgi:hypothetical protein